MAVDLDLRIEKHGDNIIVSWRDSLSNFYFFDKLMWVFYSAPIIYALLFILPADMPGEDRFIYFIGTIFLGPVAGMALWWIMSGIFRFSYTNRKVTINSRTNF